MNKIIDKVWGHEEILISNELYAAKLMHLKRDYRCSIHRHRKKDETFYIMSGVVELEFNGKPRTMETGDSIRIKPCDYHRFTGITDSVILEVSTADDPNDSYRHSQSEKVPGK